MGDRVILYSVEGCGHNDIEYRKGREFKRRLRGFVRTQIKKQKGATDAQRHKNQYEHEEHEQKMEMDIEPVNAAVAVADVETHSQTQQHYRAPHIKEISYEQQPEDDVDYVH